MKIDKTYTIKFGYAGVSQYATFYESDGKLVRPTLSVSWMKVDDQPSVKGLETIEEVLTVIKEIFKSAKIYLINSMPVNVYNNTDARKAIDKFDDELIDFLELKAIDFFENILEPIFKKNKWFMGFSGYGFPVVIEKDSDGEWDNIRRDNKEFDMEYICYQFVRNFKNVEVVLQSESTNHINGFRHFFNIIPTDYFKNKGYLIDLD